MRLGREKVRKVFAYVMIRLVQSAKIQIQCSVPEFAGLNARWGHSFETGITTYQ